MIRLAIRGAALSCLLALCACSGPVEGLVGQYEAEGPAGGPAAGSANGPAPRLHLRSDGGGGLSAGALDEPLRWEVRENSVLLHTLRGGVVTLARTGQGLEGEVPDMGRVVFRKK